MALTISEDELLQMPPDLLRRLQEYLSQQRGLGQKSESNIAPPVSSAPTASRAEPEKLEIYSDEWEPEGTEGLVLQEVKYKGSGKDGSNYWLAGEPLYNNQRQQDTPQRETTGYVLL